MECEDKKSCLCVGGGGGGVRDHSHLVVALCFSRYFSSGKTGLVCKHVNVFLVLQP